VTQGPPEDRSSAKDPKPFHARDVTTGQEAADVVAAVIKHAAERDEAAKKKAAPKAQPIWMLPLGVMLSVFAGFLLVAPPAWVVVNPIAAQAPEEQLTRLGSTLFLYISKIESYRNDNNGQLPPTLDAVGGGGEGIEYTPRGQTYVISAILGDEILAFDSAVEAPLDWAAREVGNLSGRIGG
jgi:hypothetical protein